MTYYDHVKNTYWRLFLSYSCITHNIPYIYLNIGNYRWTNYFNNLKYLPITSIKIKTPIKLY